MDAIAGLLVAAKGLRTSLGRFPTKSAVAHASGFLDSIVDIYLDVARSEAEDGSMEQQWEREDLIGSAIRRRSNHLRVFGDREMTADEFDRAAMGRSCKAGCNHPFASLLMWDDMFAEIIRFHANPASSRPPIPPVLGAFLESHGYRIMPMEDDSAESSDDLD